MKFISIFLRAVQFIGIYGSMSFFPVLMRDIGLSGQSATWVGAFIGFAIFLAADGLAERLKKSE